MKGPSDVPSEVESAPCDDRACRDRALFDRIASSYAGKDLYEPSRIARIARLRRTVESCGLGPQADILEIGCGAGFAAQYLSGCFGTYTGIDYSEALIRFASQLGTGPNTRFHTADFYDWRPDETYDLIFAIGVLHHMPDIPRAMASIHALLKPGGFLVVNEPQPSNVLFHGMRKFRSVVDASYSSEQEELSETDLLAHFGEAGFVSIESRGQGMLSTPFAEVMLGPCALARPLSAIACRVDAWLENRVQAIVKPLAWNIVVSGRRRGAREKPLGDPRADVD